MNEPVYTHALVCSLTDGRRFQLEVFESYDDALVAYNTSLDWYRAKPEAERPPVYFYAVRDHLDPHYQRTTTRNDLYPIDAVRQAVRARHRQEIGATALSMIKSAGPNERLDSVIDIALRSLRSRGFRVERHEVERAVKDRVVLGRCRRDRYGAGCDKGYWFPRSEGRLADKECPSCRVALAQSSLALGSGFRRLAREEVAI